MYLPRGIKEAVKDDGSPLSVRERPTHQSSIGIQELESVRNGAKFTLKGLMAFQWASLFMALSGYAALGAVALLAGAVWNAGPAQAAEGTMDGGLMALGGWVAGTFAFILCLLAGWMALQGVRSSHKGRSELGALQRREVEAAERAFYRGLVFLIAGGAAAIWIAFQEPYRDSRVPLIPSPTLVGFGVATLTGLLAAASFGSFFSRYLRNLMPGGAKRSRRRFRLLFVIAWTMPIAIAVAGLAAVMHVNDWGCTYNADACGSQQWSLSAPSFGPAFFLVGELVYDQYVAFTTAMGIVVGSLAVSRLFGVLATGSYRKSLRTAELVLRARIRAGTPTERPQE